MTMLPHLAAALALAIAGACQAATISVRPGDDLAEAVTKAQAGDVIEVARGQYRANLLIDKPLTLRGLDRPTISGGNQGDTIRVTAPDVLIEGLIVRDSGDSLKDQNAGIYLYPGAHRAIVRRCDLTYNLFGLWIEKANDVLIEHNTITGKREYASPQRGNGVQLYNTKGAKILNNDISFVRDALYVDVSHNALFKGNKLHHSRYGTHYMNSYYNLWEDNDTFYNRGGLALMEVRHQEVRNNRAWGNSDHGIMLRTLQDSDISGNVVAGNNRGFFIYDVEYIKLNDNLVVDNVVGVHLSAGSTRNEVEGNDFIANREQVRYVGARDEVWGKQRGNYWSNYLGWDRNNDGKGDVQYEANDMVDRLTWRHPSIKLLLASPAVQALRLVGQQFPVLRVPSVVDPHPRMRPHHQDWSQWRGKHFPGQ
ncbi:MAG TPA: nitrous oxide reductase family maturation protein NosD [Alicycliphilus sp.]|uniref:Nitrous oxide reductase family maturation protein NosD n=2 Tax=Comamonadaceae TaxID=80864 RepID=A0ABZ0J8Q8_9BURK|nr:nitrous oxide reductase family maturation protein NosD [Diaphorobacter sp. Y-1]MBP6751478.1 nitrous oxide reductase family maturation protein NosD [Alicycliphilus sp.]MCA0440453.1 nitrous oxide reductase family maturation protein NosD [Pseudomonadota bacterium]MBP7324746.1 nitrous oxide reductase family maturation protein NosD [Alicycliphilus sp.]MBP7327832.1 nitrous oxide reductase family maturation protein NosD [Alicycliphilus sp.]MBP8779358.1 nitrous oxide reductase family maturation pro